MIAQLALLAALAAPSVAKLSGADGGTMTISAQRARYNLPKHVIEYTGNPVRLTRGDAVLTCKRLGAQLNDAEQVQQATCEGEVRFERGDKVITCEKATYDETASRLTCEGHPVLTSSGLKASGTKLVYDLVPEEVTLEGVQGEIPGEQADQKLHDYQARRKSRREGQK